MSLMSNESSDEMLMLAYQMGDETAFAHLYARYSGRVYAYLRKKLNDEARARDVFQATFLKLHRSRAQYLAKFTFAQWIFTLCRSEVIDAHRKHARSLLRFPEQLPEPKVEPEGMNDALESLAEGAKQKMDKLPLNQKQALSLRYLEEQSFFEIAERLKTNEPNARKLVSRALQNLRSAYGKQK